MDEMKFNIGLTLAEFDELGRLIEGDHDDYNEEMLENVKQRLDRISTKIRKRLATADTNT